jgi:hypothetical protein
MRKVVPLEPIYHPRSFHNFWCSGRPLFLFMKFGHLNGIGKPLEIQSLSDPPVSGAAAHLGPCSAPLPSESLPLVSAPCAAHLDESVDPQDLLTLLLLLFVQENAKGSHRHRRISGRHCVGVRRTPNQAKVATTPSHPRRPLIQVEEPGDPPLAPSFKTFLPPWRHLR